MDIFGVLSLIGGLALFLYGMHVMGAGLEKMSGGRLERILENLTSNPLKAVLLGAGVTAVIQSSSATTVMVVGFVNSGIMKLSQAIGIIMGANIGTTITAWLLSLTGIQGDNLFINMLKPTSFSPILALIGIILLMSGKSDKKKITGEILLGFVVLMYGMSAMSGAVEPLADVPEFTNLLTMFKNPILGVLAGALLTAVIQSSSASVGILQALSVTGGFTFGSAIPIILGQNIGTCVTALLSAIGASKNAKRTAFVHLYFNLIGTILFMVIFYTINAFAPFAFLGHAAGPAGIATIHSLFNIGATIVLFPFSNILEKLACLSIPEREEHNAHEKDTALQQLDPRFLDQPGFALMQAARATQSMAQLSSKALCLATGLIFEYDIEASERVDHLEKEVDHYEDSIGNYLTMIAGRHLSAQEGKRLVELQHCVGDFERISDISLNLMHAVSKMQKKQQEFSPKAVRELHVLADAVQEMMDSCIACFEKDDIKSAQTIEPLEECIDELKEEISRRHHKRLRRGKCSVDMGFVLEDITTDLERIGDHLSNVALAVIQNGVEGIEAHEYVEKISSGEDIWYEGRLLAFQEKYQLP